MIFTRPNSCAFKADYALELFSPEVQAFWKKHAQTGIMRRDGLRIPYVFFKHPEETKKPKSVVVFTGVSECILKYLLVYYDLFQGGYNVFGVDHRSQGISDRPLSNRQKINVTDFSEYVDDAYAFVHTVVKKNIPVGEPRLPTNAYQMCIYIYMSHPKRFPSIIHNYLFTSLSFLFGPRLGHRFQSLGIPWVG